MYKVVQIEQGRDKMQKRKVNLNTLYFSDRLQAELRGIGRHALTLVVAPMGYGKTTAVQWFLDRRRQDHRCKLVPGRVRPAAGHPRGAHQHVFRQPAHLLAERAVRL